LKQPHVRPKAEKSAFHPAKTIPGIIGNIPTFDYGFLWDIYGFLWDIYGLFTGCRLSGYPQNMGFGWVLDGKKLGYSDMNMGFYGKNMGYPCFW